MAPHKNDSLGLHAPLIPAEEQQTFPRRESLSEQSSLLSDQLDVVIVQPGGQASLTDEDSNSCGKLSTKSNSSMKKNKKKGPEVPVNCPHLETALFFFGIAGMIVSVVMLFQHIIGSVISSYY